MSAASAPPTAAKKRKRAPRWSPRAPAPRAVFAAILVILGVVLALSACRVRSARVSLNASAEEVSFVTSAPTPTSELLLRDLAWNSAVVELLLPDATVVETDYFHLSGGLIALPPLPLAEGVEVTIRAEGDRHTLLFSTDHVDLPGDEEPSAFLFSDGGAELELSLPPGVRVDPGDGELRAFDGADPVVRVRGRPDWFYVSGTVVRRDRIAESIPIRSLTFWREAPGRASDPVLSTVREGLLVLDEVGGRRIELREGEPFALGGIDGVLRSGALVSGLVEIQVDGRARGLKSGYGEGARSLMPSLLDRLVSIPQVKAVLGIVAVLIGSSIPFLRKDG